MWKRVAFILVAIGVLVLASLTAYAKIAQNRREASYRVAMTPFERDLHVGMDRAEPDQIDYGRECLRFLTAKLP